jgi:hypothetical protein
MKPRAGGAVKDPTFDSLAVYSLVKSQILNETSVTNIR